MRPTVFTWRWWRRLVPFPTGMGARAVASLFLVTFGLAALAPPCEMHDSMRGSRHGAAHAAVEHGGSHDQHVGHNDGSREECGCLGDCHLATTLATLPSEYSFPRVDAETRTASWTPEIRRVRQPYILPFATAPPING